MTAPPDPAVLAGAPGSLDRLVTRGPDWLQFATPQVRPLASNPGAVVVLGTGLWLVVASLLALAWLMLVLVFEVGGGYGGLAFWGGLALTPLLGLGYAASTIGFLAWVALPARARVSPGRLVLRGLIRDRELPLAPIRVGGEPGRAMRVWVGEHEIARLPVSPSGRGWTLEAIQTFLDELTGRLGVPLHDVRPLDRWEAWRGSARVRSLVAFRIREEDDQEAHAELHRQPPYAPRERYDHHSRVTVIPSEDFVAPEWRLKWLQDRIEFRDGHIVWHEVRDVRVLFGSDAGGMTRGAVDVWVEGIGRVNLVDVLFRERAVAGQLRWIADEIRERIERAALPADLGDAEEVPDALSRLRGTAAE